MTRPPSPAWPTIRAEMRFEQYNNPLRDPYIVDVDDRYRCEDCDALLMRRRHKCDRCKAITKIERAQRRKHGRHRA